MRLRPAPTYFLIILIASSATPGTSPWTTIPESTSASPSLCHELRNELRGGRLGVADLCCGSRAPAQLRHVVLLTADGPLRTLRNYVVFPGHL